MTDYEKWLVMARASFATGDLAKESSDLRSSASRYYYAAYQAVTALLVYIGATLPDDREAWSHEDTPIMVVQRISSNVLPRDERIKIRNRLAQLYRLRVKADYKITQTVSTDEANEARREVGFIIDTVSDTI